MSSDGAISFKELWGNGSAKLPRLFFAWNDGKNPKSVQVVLEFFRTKCIPDAGIKAEVFSDEAELASYLTTNKINYLETVEFNDFARKGGTISYVYYRAKDRARVPYRGKGLWGVAVNPSLSERRFLTVVNQVFADLHTNFSERLSKNQFPWGQVPSPLNRAARRVTKWKLRQQGRSASPRLSTSV